MRALTCRACRAKTKLTASPNRNQPILPDRRRTTTPNRKRITLLRRNRTFCCSRMRIQNKLKKPGFLRKKNIRSYAEKLIDEYDVRSGQGPVTTARSMSGGNQQKAIIGREIDREPSLLVAVQPTRGLDIGAIESVHKQIVAQRDAGKAVLLVSLEMDEVLDVSDRILVMYEGEIVGQLDPKTTTPEEMGLYMSGAKREEV